MTRVVNGERKVRMATPYNMPMLITRDTNVHDPEPLFIFTMTEFEVKDGNIRWTMTSQKGEIFEGNLGTEETLTEITGFGPIKIVLSIPVVIHKYNPTLAPEFMITLPKELRVHTLKTLKKRFGTDNRFFK